MKAMDLFFKGCIVGLGWGFFFFFSLKMLVWFWVCIFHTLINPNQIGLKDFHMDKLFHANTRTQVLTARVCHQTQVSKTQVTSFLNILKNMFTNENSL